MAIVWWTVLLYKNNEIIFELKNELAESSMELQEVHRVYNVQKKMIFGEGLFIMVALATGILLIRRSYKREIQNTKAQRNFLLSVTHELKSPIAGIKLAIETLKKRKLNAEQTSQITQSALTETNRLGRLVENLLNATSIEHSYHPVLRETDIDSLLKAIQKRNTVHRNRVVYQNIKEDTSRFSLDIDGLVLIGDNLVENACKYSDEDVYINMWVENKFCYVQVIDEGIGIPEDEYKNIMKRFYRIGSEETRKSKGTGIGLYIVKKVIVANKGQLSINGNQPKGTIFEVKIPIT